MGAGPAACVAVLGHASCRDLSSRMSPGCQLARHGTAPQRDRQTPSPAQRQQFVSVAFTVTDTGKKLYKHFFF